MSLTDMGTWILISKIAFVYIARAILFIYIVGEGWDTICPDLPIEME